MKNTIEALTDGLTPEQSQAVIFPGAGRLRISAGAGSGKTEVLTRRIVALLEAGIKPSELVAITYTTKAAAEMKTRLVEKRKLHPGRLRDMEVSTFHSFLSRFLRQDPFGAGMDRSDAVVAENTRQLIIAELVEKFAEIFGPQIIEGPEALGAAVAIKLIREFPSALGKIRRYLLKPAEFYNFARKLFSERLDGVTQLEKNSLEWLYRFYTCYLEELEKRGLLDFDEILIRGRNLIKDLRQTGTLPERRIFLIDEFQDNNPDQLEIVNLFCRGRESHISVVGDEKQSIYRFQGANIETFRNFDSNQDIILKDNFRSFNEIITVADAFLERGGDCGKMFVRQSARRGNSGRFPAVSCLLTPDESTNEQICDQLAEMIRTISTSGIRITDRKTGQSRALRYGDIAIIVSSIRGLPRDFEDAMAARQIPYLMSGGFSFYARSEIEEIMAFLKLLAQPNDDYSVVKILTGPLYGLKDSELAQLSSAGRHEKTALLPHILAQKADVLSARTLQFRDLFISLKERSGKPGLLSLCHTILEQAGFYEYAASQASDLKRRRMENNLAKFLGIVRNFEQNGIFTSLRDFLTYIERVLLSDIDEDEAGLGLEEGDAIKVMTIHKSKGLEFPVVFCPFLKRRHYRDSSRIYFDREHGLIVNDPSQTGKKGASPLLEKYLLNDRMASEQEDRRKLYVAFTRAEDILVITGKHSLSLPPEKENEPSEPLHEICEILQNSPDLGSIAMLSEWPAIVTQWLEHGQAEIGTAAVSSLPQPDIAELETSIRAITTFLNTEQTQAHERHCQQEIFSLQDLNLFNACPRRYFFNSRHVNSFNERQQSFSSTLGTLVHETIRVFHGNGGHNLLSKSAAIQKAIDLLATLIHCYGENGQHAGNLARSIVKQYVLSELAQKEPWMIEAEVNVKFDAPEGAFFVRGFADRVDRNDGEIRIIDFKTKRFTPEAHASYRDQLALYRIAASRGVLGDIGCLNFARSHIAYLTPDDVQIIEIEPQLLTFEEHINQTVKAIRTETAWKPAKGASCQDCGFSILCHGAISPTS